MSNKPAAKSKTAKRPKGESEPVRDTMEGVAKAIFAAPAKKDWRYQRKR